MESLNIKAESRVMQQVLASLNKLAEAGNEIEVEYLEANHTSDNSWDDILQNEQVMQGLRKSIQQAKNGELLSEEETFKQLYSELEL